MPWVKLDDQWIDHPKIISAGRDARDMWLASLTYCAKHLTDGYFPTNLLPTLAVMAGVDVANCQALATVLLDVGLWEADGNQYMVHDYLDYNPTKEQVQINHAARSEAGRAGGLAKASKTLANGLANGLAKSWQNSAPSPSPSPSPRERDIPTGAENAPVVPSTFEQWREGYRKADNPSGQAYTNILERWATLFPTRPHPTENNKALREKATRRLKDDDFLKNWDAALVRMTRADPWVFEKAWFTLNWFLANDENWRKCYDGNYDRKGSPSPSAMAVGLELDEVQDPDLFFAGGKQ
jgi:hypothetical protein